MNILASELNETLQNTAAYGLLSEFGKRFYFPKGIAAQSAEATKKASRYNATIGMAFDNGEPLMLPSLVKHLDALTPREAVAYAPNAGDPALRELWADQIRQKNPDLGNARFSTPTIVSGLTNGIAQLADLFADPDDIVLVPDMFWGNYRLIFEVRKQASVELFPFFADDGTFNTDGLSAALARFRSRGKIIVMLNFPNNPTGYSPTTEEANAIAAALRTEAEAGTQILAITDDAYFGLFYEADIYPQSLFSKLADLHENILAVKIDGSTKEDFVWGFRIGFVTFAGKNLNDDQLAALERKLLGAIRSSISNSSRPAQSLLVKVLTSGEYEVEKKRFFDLLSSRYRLVRSIVDSSDKDVLSPLPFNSGYFMSFRVLSDQAETLRQRLLDERQIGTIAIQDAYLRIAYSAVSEDEISPLYDEVFAMAKSLS